MCKPDPDFEMVIAITIAIEKPIRINQDPIFISQPGFVFSISIKSGLRVTTIRIHPRSRALIAPSDSVK